MLGLGWLLFLASLPVQENAGNGWRSWHTKTERKDIGMLLPRNKGNSDMEYEFTVPLPLSVIAVVSGFLFGFISFARLQNWVAKQLSKNRVTVVIHKAGKEHKFWFSTVKDAAANALERVGNGERVAYIEAGGRKGLGRLREKQQKVSGKVGGGIKSYAVSFCAGPRLRRRIKCQN